MPGIVSEAPSAADPSRRRFMSRAGMVLCLPALARDQVGAVASKGIRSRDPEHVVSMLGVAVSNETLSNMKAQQLIAKHFTGITCQSAMKSRVIYKEPGRLDFSHAEVAVGFAERHNIAVRGHTLLWHLGMPTWLNNLVVSGLSSRIMEQYIHDVARHFRGRIMAWDVINEPLSDSSDRSNGPLKPTVLKSGLGEDFIARAFSISQEADPASRKYLNDFFFLLPDNRCRNKMYNCLRYAERLLSAGIPLHGIGIQGHLNAGALLPFRERASFFSEIKQLGLEVSITELDVRDLNRRASVQARDQIVASTVDSLLDSLTYAGDCCPVFTWGLSDNAHARVILDKYKVGVQRPNPFDGHYQPKMLLDALTRRLGCK